MLSNIKGISCFSGIGSANHEGTSMGSLPRVSRKHRKAPHPSAQPPHAGPHKIFVWDPNGVYLNYYFLNPVYGHFVEPTLLIGATIQDVLSRGNSRRLAQAIARTRKGQVPHRTDLTFHRDGCRYQAIVQCFYMGDRVLGIVTDALQGENGSSSPFVASAPTLRPLNHRKLLTPREQFVFARLDIQPSTRPSTIAEGSKVSNIHYVRHGLTNKELSEEMSVSIRTVKEHVSNIYQKLQIISRHHRRLPENKKSS